MKNFSPFFTAFVTVAVLIGGYLVMLFAPPLFPEVAQRKFVSEDGNTVVTFHNMERTMLGDESALQVWIEQGKQRSQARTIELNSRIVDTDRYRAYISSDGHWVRACKDIPAQNGVLVWKTNAELIDNYEPNPKSLKERWMRGQWKVVNSSDEKQSKQFDVICSAYINRQSDKIIRKTISQSTREQRESLLFAPKAVSDHEDEIDGQAIQWMPMNHLD